MKNEWEARYERRGRFRLRRRARLVGVPVLVGSVGLVGSGAAVRLWERFDGWLWDTVHLAGDTAVGAVLIAVLFTWLWRRTGD